MRGGLNFSRHKKPQRTKVVAFQWTDKSYITCRITSKRHKDHTDNKKTNPLLRHKECLDRWTHIQPEAFPSKHDKTKCSTLNDAYTPIIKIKDGDGYRDVMFQNIKCKNFCQEMKWYSHRDAGNGNRTAPCT